MGGCNGSAPSFFLLPPSWKLFYCFLLGRADSFGDAVSAGHDPLWEKIFGKKQKEILADVSNSQLWLSVGHGGGYLVMPFMQTDLQKIMGMEFSEDKIQYLVYQMLKGLKDLKPGNLAVNEDCELKILDFGLARPADAQMTGYVVTRWYRAPEVILSWMHYNQTVDIWSVGCIMAEMLTGKTLFKGKDYLDQLTQILKVTGVPGAEFVQKLKDKAAKSYIQALPQSPKKDFSQLFPRASPQAIDLLEKMLELDVDKRLTASQALTHPFFEPFRDPEEETEAQQPFDDSLEHEKLTVDEWKQHIYKEIVNFSPIARKDSRRRSGMKLQ
ncbi:mitogen-activated protein kinase 13 isoform X7 [Equus asinus]|uniref:mitogen-activated protein kinase 13 isoform X7 n=1 Tax=Equus asinus TaxID=9793 RepID=UPI0038F62C8C